MQPGAASVTIDDLLAHAGWASRLARRLARDAASADDLLQQAWLRAMEAPPSARSAAPGWFATILSNLARDAHRRSTRRAVHERSAARPEAGRPEDLVARAEAEREVIRAVVDLPEPFRTAVLLRYYEDLGAEEIGRRTGVPAATARTRIHRGLGALRKRLGGPGGALAAFAPTDSAADTIGGLAMGKATKTAAVALLLLLVGGVVCMTLDRDDPAPAAPAEPSAAAAQPKPAPRPRAGTTERAGPANPPAAAALSGAPEDPAPATSNRLETKFVRWLGRSAPPPGVKVIEDEDDIVIPDDETVVTDGGGMVSVGWSEWAPVPKRGQATFSVRVLDADGKPLEGAEVHRIRPDDRGARPNPCSFQWIDEIGKTGTDGVLRADRQPEGPFLIAADWKARMLTPRGLDIAPAVPIQSTSADQEVTIRLPVRPSLAAAVEGTVRDADGNPVRRARIECGFAEGRTGADGRYRMEGLASGARALMFRATGYADTKAQVSLADGESATVDVVMRLAASGDVSLTGRVVDEEGTPVGGAPLFLHADTRDVSRWERSRDDGTFSFEKLPERVRKTGVTVMVSPWMEDLPFIPEEPAAVHPPDAVTLTITRTVKVKILFRDAVTGEPVTLFKGDLHSERDGKEPRQLSSMSQYNEEGEFEVNAPKGRLVLAIEAKGYRGMEVAADIADLAGPKEMIVLFEKQ